MVRVVHDDANGDQIDSLVVFRTFLEGQHSHSAVFFELVPIEWTPIFTNISNIPINTGTTGPVRMTS